MKYDYDVIILGSGPAGFSCAMQSSKLGKKALIIESDSNFFGGTWINTGTLPSKSLQETAHIIRRFQNQFEHNKASAKPYENYKIADLLSYKDKMLGNKSNKLISELAKNEVDTLQGLGKFKSPHEIEITLADGTKTIKTGKNILISTGSRPVEPKGFKIDGNKILGYNTVLNLTHIPRRLVIIGSGVKATEFATIFSNLGTRVSILSEKSEFLPFLDHEIRAQLHIIFEEDKVELTTNVEKISISDNDLRNTTEVKFSIKNDKEPGRQYVIETEHVLYLGGKQPNSDSLGLKKVDLKLNDDGTIKVSKHYQTEIENIFAAGDVIGYPSSASASFAEGRLAACKMFGVDLPEVPTQSPFGIYSIPEMADMGLTEKEATEKGYNVTVGRAYYQNVTQADISNQQHGLLKLVFETETLKLLGVHIIGERAADLIHVGQAVMTLGGDIRYFADNIMNYPTYSEAYRIAAFNGLNRVHKTGIKYKKLLNKKSE